MAQENSSVRAGKPASLTFLGVFFCFQGIDDDDKLNTTPIELQDNKLLPTQVMPDEARKERHW